MLSPIKRARMIAGFTQCDLAKQLGVSPVAVSKWESGKAFPNVKRLRAISEILGIPVEEMIEQEGRAV